MLQPADLPPQQLAVALRAHAACTYAEEAAVALLIEHRAWLRRPDFHRHIALTPAGAIPL